MVEDYRTAHDAETIHGGIDQFLNPAHRRTIQEDESLSEFWRVMEQDCKTQRA